MWAYRDEEIDFLSPAYGKSPPAKTRLERNRAQLLLYPLARSASLYGRNRFGHV